MPKEDKKIIKRQLTGTVTSDKMSQTVVVAVERLKMHPKYKKRYTIHTKYKAHDPKGAYHPGDLVLIQETRPLSKDKHWKVIEKIEKGKE